MTPEEKRRNKTANEFGACSKAQLIEQMADMNYELSATKSQLGYVLQQLAEGQDIPNEAFYKTLDAIKKFCRLEELDKNEKHLLSLAHY